MLCEAKPTTPRMDGPAVKPIEIDSFALYSARSARDDMRLTHGEGLMA